MEAWRARRRRLQLQQILLLVIRCLIPVVLGLALAQPLLSGTNLFKNSGNVIHLIIDNSMASSLEDSAGETPLDRHQAKALEIIKSANPGDEIGVIPLSGVDQRQLIPVQRDHSAVVAAIKRMTSTRGPADIPRVLEDVSRRISGDSTHSHRVVLLTDFREGSGRIDEPLPSGLLNMEHIQLEYSSPATDPIEQVRVTNVTPLRRIALREGGVESLASQCLVYLERDGEQLPGTTTTLKAISSSGQTTTKQISWKPGVREAVVDLLLPLEISSGDVSSIRIEAGNSIAAQQHHTLIEMQDVLRVVILDRDKLGRDALPVELDAANWLERALKPSEELPIEIRRVDPVSMVRGDFLDVDAVILLRPDLLENEGWHSVADFRENGGLVMVIPPGDRTVHGWTDAMIREMDIDWTFAKETTLLDPHEGLVVSEADDSVLGIIGVELPGLLEPVGVQKILEVSPGIEAVTSLRTDSGQPLLITESKPGKGTLLFLATSPRLDWTSLPANPLMVPLVQESLRGGLHIGRSQQNMVVGVPIHEHVHELQTGELRHSDGTSVLISDPQSSLDRPGTWLLSGDDGSGSDRIIANVDSSAGDMDYQQAEAVDAWLADTGQWQVMTEKTSTDGPGYNLVWLLLGILAGLLLIESLLSRLFNPHSSGMKLQTGFVGSAP